MIDQLIIAKAATFFKIKRRLTDKSIRELFTSLRAHYSVTKNNHFRYIRQSINGARCSVICFSYEQSPAFLSLPRNPARTMRIFSSLLNLRRACRLILRTTLSASALWVFELCFLLIFDSFVVFDKPKTSP